MCWVTRSLWGGLFKVDARGLVPRPETEELVERILERVKGREGLRALDVGCGSGVIGLTLAVELGERVAGVTLVDISADARELAVENRGLLGLDESVDVIESDLLAGGRWKKVRRGCRELAVCAAGGDCGVGP